MPSTEVSLVTLNEEKTLTSRKTVEELSDWEKPINDEGIG
jgi:hypothetical protein